MTEKYTGVKTIDFSDWNSLYQFDVIPLTALDQRHVYYQNMIVVLKSSENESAKDFCIVKGSVIQRIVNQYYPCDIKPKNKEQKFTLELLKDKDIKLVTISGAAGSGKTLLACAHALEELDQDRIRKVIIAKSLTPVGKEIGYLKGTLEDKVLPWLGAFKDNFEKCGYSSIQLEEMIKHEQIEISPITFIQGRSISDAVIIVDECQNLDMMIIKQIITRAGQNTKIILLGDQSQVFEKVKSNTMDLLAEKGKDSPLIAHITLLKTVRSPLAEWAVKNL